MKNARFSCCLYACFVLFCKWSFTGRNPHYCWLFACCRSVCHLPRLLFACCFFIYWCGIFSTCVFTPSLQPRHSWQPRRTGIWRCCNHFPRSTHFLADLKHQTPNTQKHATHLSTLITALLDPGVLHICPVSTHCLTPLKHPRPQRASALSQFSALLATSLRNLGNFLRSRPCPQAPVTP